ncbi:MAG TPA: hypothetical protein VFE05_00400 [Longimicrobiaceae bacterium]|jgi:hypothetical protein|nr:hypothetical protein [Longimicrobiaceae bacterium]
MRPIALAALLLAAACAQPRPAERAGTTSADAATPPPSTAGAPDAAGGARGPDAPGPASGPATSSAAASDTTPRADASPDAAARRLEAEARALAHTDGCEGADQCRAAPAGLRACGGPRTYVVYCAARTDTVALFRVLGRLRAADEAYNRANGVMSTCEFRTPPQTRIVGGRCEAVSMSSGNRAEVPQ